MTEAIESFGKNIRSIRKKRKMTQKMLSEEICSQSVLSRIENDEELPNVLVMHQLCQRLGVTVDQVMLFHTTGLHQTTLVFDRLENKFVHKKYQELLAELENPDFLDALFLDTDFQQYYYFLGSCDYFVNQNYEGAIENLKKGLSYTYQQEKNNVSLLEIRILSCLGRVYSDAGLVTDARLYLTKSYDSYRLLPPERYLPTLAKVLCNYADFLYKQKEEAKALQVVEEGISLALQKNSLYYLEELFDLRSKIYLSQENEVLAKESQELVQAVQKVLKIK